MISDELLYPELKRGVDDNELEVTNTTLINFFKTSSTLPTDENRYACRAVSAFGRTQETTNLMVQGTV